MPFRPLHLGVGRRALIGACVLAALLSIGVAIGNAGEILPSIGLTKAVDGNGEATPFVGVAFRGGLTPLLMTEVGVGYRSESRYNDQLKVRQWPITASLYVTPLPSLYAGGGVGWYQTTLDYKDNTLVADETRQDFGVHLGGGLQIPVAPKVGLDLNGRYVMMRQQDSHLVPQKFDPDFWTTSLGLAFKF